MQLPKRMGKQTVKLQTPPSIVSTACTVGPKEGEGPLRSYFDNIIEDELWGEKTWEKAESKLVKQTFSDLLRKSGKSQNDINYIIAGDLLNQCIGATFGLKETEIPFLGIYGACSTMCEAMCIGSMLIDGEFADSLVCMTSSHFCSSEKQFRFPLELGTQRAPTSQWTVTGAGAALISNQGNGPYITHTTTGKIVDMGIKDVNNMGAAMAPAAADTIITHFRDTGFEPSSYDLIVTGDLGNLGKNICEDMLRRNGYDVSGIYDDCGAMIFDNGTQGTCAGGSGCGCLASVFTGYIYKKLEESAINHVLLVSTGALFSTTSIQQGEGIPAIAHAVSVSKFNQ